MNGLYIVAVLATVFVIDFALRAVPFAILKPLRESSLVQRLAVWMPAGILLILAMYAFHDQIETYPNLWFAAPVASAVTIALHLLCGRRTLLSVGGGTLVYVLLVNFL